MTELEIPTPLEKSAMLDLLAAGACIQRDRHGAAMIQIHGRCGEEWEEMRRAGWLSKTVSGTYVLNDRGRDAKERGL